MSVFVNPSRIPVFHYGNWQDSENCLKMHIFHQFECCKGNNTLYIWYMDVFWEFQRKKNFLKFFPLRIAWKVPDLTWGNVGSPYECDVPWPKTNRRGMFLCNRITGQPACILYNNNMYIRLTTCVRYCIVKPQLRSRANFKDLIRTWTETS